MDPRTNYHKTPGCGLANFLALLAAMLILFRAAGLIDWSWWAVAAPLAFLLLPPATLAGLVFLVALATAWRRSRLAPATQDPTPAPPAYHPSIN